MSWGYDQTNVDAFQVTRITPKGVYVREIQTRGVPGSNTGGMSQKVVVVKDAFCARGQWCGDENKELFRKIKNGGFTIKGRYSARQTTETEEHYESWYA
jgi:hypothetical protein